MITRDDTLRHKPEADEPLWQESFFLCWVDVKNRCACHCHISLSPFHGKAHLWAWLMVDGKEVGRSRENALSLPAENFDNISLGAGRFVTGDTIGELLHDIDFGNGTRANVTYNAYTDPVELDFDEGALKLGSNHYESMGSIQGKLTHKDKSIDIQGWGWHDHSWGVRTFTSNPAGRWIFAAFGDDLAISAFNLSTPAGSVEIGYVLDNGVIHPVSAVDAGVTVSDDGTRPMRADSTIWTRSGRGYRLQAEILGTALTGGPGWAEDSAYVSTDGLARFEHAGRIGGGLIEVSNPRSIHEDHKTALGIP
jgi:hypothetical protein